MNFSAPAETQPRDEVLPIQKRREEDPAGKRSYE